MADFAEVLARLFNAAAEWPLRTKFPFVIAGFGTTVALAIFLFFSSQRVPRFGFLDAGLFRAPRGPGGKESPAKRTTESNPVKLHKTSLRPPVR